MQFGDFTNQIEYQNAGAALNRAIKKSVLEKLDRNALPGKTVEVIGVFRLLNASNWLITPVSVPLQANQQAAAAQYGVGSPLPVIPVRLEGVVQPGEKGIFPLQVAGVPESLKVRLQTGPALSGTDLRDRRRLLLTAVLSCAVIAGIALDTHVVRTDAAGQTQQGFSPDSWAEQHFPEVKQSVERRAVAAQTLAACSNSDPDRSPEKIAAGLLTF
ncbi:hypothetical protein CRX72_17485 [Pantoea sp. BRM17]|nr:hypothetical protein CRX72_17485 [Pantoea sp. BRM17]